MYKVRKLHCILDKEDGNVVADNVEVSFLRIKLNRKAANIARKIRRTARTCYCREANEDGRLYRRILQEPCLCVLRHRLVHLKITMGRRAPCVHHSFGNAFVIEVSNLLAQNKVFEESRSALTCFKGVLVVVDPNALVCG